jgi:O-antigen/teichoic acid export membrane protein
MFALPFQSALWIFYRRMDFFRQRVLGSIDALLGSTVMISMAIAGAGTWSFIIGTIVGAWATAVVSVWQSPYKLRIRRDVKAFREYGSFSYPLVVMGLCGFAVAQGTMLVGKWELGLAGAGAITLASSITVYTERLNELLMRSLYPALCVAHDRLDVLHEAFIKSNRLSLMWALPFGTGVVLFAPDLVNHVLGAQWHHATTLIQLFAVTAALRHVAGNWGGFYMARGETKPQMTRALIVTAWFFAAVIPAMVTWGLPGLGWAMIGQALVGLSVQGYYMRKLFVGFKLLPHFARSWMPLVPAVGVVLAIRLTESGPRDPWMAIVEMLTFLVVVGAATLALERPLLREASDYLRSRQGSGALVAS